jgi:hypothetical protein
MKFVELEDRSYRKRRINFDLVLYYLELSSGNGSHITFLNGSTVDVRETPKQIDDILNGQQGPNTELALDGDTHPKVL